MWRGTKQQYFVERKIRCANIHPFYFLNCTMKWYFRKLEILVLVSMNSQNLVIERIPLVERFSLEIRFLNCRSFVAWLLGGMNEKNTGSGDFHRPLFQITIGLTPSRHIQKTKCRQSA